MELSHFINLIFIFALNVFFFFSGICLNSLVILSFWKSVQLRKKLCYFMIMVLSCCDLLVVLTNHPLMVLFAILSFTGKLDVTPSWAKTSSKATTIFVGFSVLALLVMNFDQYLATYHPFFHRTSVTKGKLLGLLGILSILGGTFFMLTANNIILSNQVGLLICLGILFPPMLFFNFKLFTIARKNPPKNRTSPEVKKAFSTKNVSNCLLAFACFVVLSIPMFVFIGQRITANGPLTLNNAFIAAVWSKTIASVNSTCNCLIFYWKNKILRAEGKKVLKGLKFGG